MNDPRIRLYREAALAMKAGQFNIQLPTGNADEVAELGRALVELGQTLEMRRGEMRQLVSVTEKINAGLLLDEVLDYIFESFRPIIPYHRIGLSFLDEETQTVTAHWARSDSAEILLGAGYSAPLAGSSLEKVIEGGQPRILNDLPAYLEHHPNSDSTARIVREGMNASLTCPLIALGKPIGFIFFSSREFGQYEHVHVEIFRQVAGQLATIVEKARLYQDLLELNEMKNRFLGIAAHDLRNPLSIQKGYIALLGKGLLGAMNEKQMQALSILDQTCGEMSAMIADLLDVHAIESGKLDLRLQEVDLPSFMQRNYEANELLASAKSIHLKLEMEADEEHRTALMDPARISQVLGNLLSNAIKFSYPDSTITLGVRRGGDGHEFYVADQGQGIPEAELPKLFTEFSKVSVAPTGGESSTGLGLAIVRKLVEAHKGRVWVQSQYGAGSTFGFVIPDFD